MPAQILVPRQSPPNDAEAVRIAAVDADRRAFLAAKAVLASLRRIVDLMDAVDAGARADARKAFGPALADAAHAWRTGR